MNIILFGPQGCGKGTQAGLIEQKYRLYHLSMGDELRKEVKSGSALGQEIKSIINKGNLAPDSITNRILMNVAKRHPNLIFDGYPRRKTQLDYIVKHFKIDAAIEIDLTEKESIRRISTRRVCPKCGRNYNIIWIKPKVPGKCDADGTILIHRDDDKPKEIKKRLGIYTKDTEPLKEYYKKIGILHVVDGNQPIKAVFSDIEKFLKRL